MAQIRRRYMGNWGFLALCWIGKELPKIIALTLSFSIYNFGQLIGDIVKNCNNTKAHFDLSILALIFVWKSLRCNRVLIFWGRNASMVPVMIPRHPPDQSEIAIWHPKTQYIYDQPTKYMWSSRHGSRFMQLAIDINLTNLFLLYWKSKWIHDLILSFHLLLSMTTSVRPRPFDCSEESAVAASNQMASEAWSICRKLFKFTMDQGCATKSGTQNWQKVAKCYCYLSCKRNSVALIVRCFKNVFLSAAVMMTPHKNRLSCIFRAEAATCAITGWPDV